MESKRQHQQEEEGDERGVQIQHSKRRREDSQQSETSRTITNFGSLFHLTNDDMMPCLSELVKKVVSDVLKTRLFPSPTSNRNGISGAKPFRLVFKNKLPATIFTFTKIKAEDNTLVEVALYDIKSQSIVAEGPLASTKIEICVLNGEFGSDGNEDWTADEFEDKILPPRDNKGKLLKGDTVITLKNGVGWLTNNMITDNSSRTRSRHFRLGAKVVLSNLNEANIREGRSEPFIVKDARGEVNQKHYPPSLKDNIWHLKYISKYGKTHERLAEYGIKTVEDLLLRNETNPSSLPEIFGNVSKKRREAIIEHAKTSVAETTFDGPNYPSQNTVDSNEEQLVDALQNVQDLFPVDQTSVHSLPSAGQSPDLQSLYLPTAQQGL
ncbi:calmodulin-binding protein 60 B-like [Abrus precatorius]|uniref:Calmodulin-binding protein 60 B-like n=1 Tax=Abrus precatorius TaxID=3816 RepID=A0A8B8L1U6_ABRPR|nr:calmodulin-binding protein 60 B-like [Abrus precatorius]